jgi:predicted esterase
MMFVTAVVADLQRETVDVDYTPNNDEYYCDQDPEPTPKVCLKSLATDGKLKLVYYTNAPSNHEKTVLFLHGGGALAIDYVATDLHDTEDSIKYYFLESKRGRPAGDGRKTRVWPVYLQAGKDKNSRCTADCSSTVEWSLGCHYETRSLTNNNVYLQQFIKQELIAKTPGGARNVYLAGYSQGAFTALFVAATADIGSEKLGGLFLTDGDVLHYLKGVSENNITEEDAGLGTQMRYNVDPKDVIMYHGSKDATFPPTWVIHHYNRLLQTWPGMSDFELDPDSQIYLVANKQHWEMNDPLAALSAFVRGDCKAVRNAQATHYVPSSSWFPSGGTNNAVDCRTSNDPVAPTCSSIPWGNCESSSIGSCLTHLRFAIDSEGKSCADAVEEIKSQCSACSVCTEADCSADFQKLNKSQALLESLFVLP